MKLYRMRDSIVFYVQLTKNKSIEAQAFLRKDFTYWFRFYFSLSRRMDHAGLTIHFDMFWFEFEFKLYDHRHWNYDNKTWE
jgi:hypothetical protein